MIHELKCWPEFFKDILQERKTFEIRKNDRNFQVGDELHLLEWDPVDKTYTGNAINCIVTHMLTHHAGLAEGYCAMSISLEEDAE